MLQYTSTSWRIQLPVVEMFQTCFRNPLPKAEQQELLLHYSAERLGC